MTASTETPREQDLLDRFRAGQRTALARAISMVENGRPGFERLLHDLHGHMLRPAGSAPPGRRARGRARSPRVVRPSCEMWRA